MMYKYFVGGDGEEIDIEAFHEGIIMRCPEGDTTMMIDEAEKDEVFLCPKHNVPLEKVEGEGKPHKIIIRKSVEK